eukprot:TRINITY_DN73480_c0_g1_i1.p1 TRINITY_DN73480_c0_g1~~TRINITY_DN73480_c0_g1_i1.p1  ORF type:complete len:414 (-),score=85.55 TRINITY_DN73480_c0_g1_i1:68-1246(-)
MAWSPPAAAASQLPRMVAGSPAAATAPMAGAGLGSNRFAAPGPPPPPPRQQQQRFVAQPPNSGGAHYVPTPSAGVPLVPQNGFVAGQVDAPPPKGECEEQQCAEEECDPEECGDETRPPRDDNYTCGLDRRPLLPVLLVTSTAVSALSMLMIQLPLVSEIFFDGIAFRVVILALHLITLACMAYCAMSDPGQLRKADQQLLRTGGDCEQGGEMPLPKRTHKTWLYKLPVRRYDHYCRWLTNVIGLMNHREFLVMCAGLVLIGVVGSVLDTVLLFAYLRQGNTKWFVTCGLLLHLTYSVTIVGLAGPILRIHVGLVSRNELANEWKKNYFYVAHSSKTGKNVPVAELSDDEFNERFDHFEYDASRNPFDKGIYLNCLNFWCVRRWTPGQMGEF